uniref:Ovule protein n=1 Tax=Heterorhabditis bacteriophora TaxID=37862 RepID=A0A1I7WPW7_HETBA
MKFKLETSKIIAPHPKKDWINLVPGNRKKRCTMLSYFIADKSDFISCDSSKLISLFSHWVTDDSEARV